MKSRCRALLFVLCALLFARVILANSSGEIVRRGPFIKFFGPVQQQFSQYSPFMFSQPG